MGLRSYVEGVETSTARDAQRTRANTAGDWCRNCYGLAVHLTKSAEVSDIEDMVQRHLALVRAIARQVHRTLPTDSGVEVSDLVQDGVIGLLGAHRAYNRSSGVPFPSYARCRVKGAMLDSLRRLDPVPRRLRRHWRNIESAQAEAENSHPSAAPKADPSPQAKRIPPGPESPVYAALSSWDVPDRGDGSPEFLASVAEMRRTLRTLILTLENRSQRVVELRTFAGLTLQQIGRRLGMSESRTYQVLQSAHKSMSHTLKTRGVRSASDMLAEMPRYVTVKHESR